MITFSDANPIQIWIEGEPTFNEKVEDGIEHICFFQPWNCDDNIPFQFSDDDGIEKDYVLTFFNALEEQVAQLSFTRQLVDGVWVYSLSFVPSDLGICNTKVFVKISFLQNGISGGVTDALEEVEGEIETIVSSTREVVFLEDPEVCGGDIPVAVYYVGAFAPGTILYLDATLTTPVTGENYVSDAFDSGNVYEIDNDGEIGADTTFDCFG